MIAVCVIESLEGSFENILTALGSGIISLSNAALSVVAGAATKIPGTFMRTVITVIATVFLTILAHPWYWTKN